MRYCSIIFSFILFFDEAFCQNLKLLEKVETKAKYASVGMYNSNLDCILYLGREHNANPFKPSPIVIRYLHADREVTVDSASFEYSGWLNQEEIVITECNSEPKDSGKYFRRVKCAWFSVNVITLEKRRIDSIYTTKSSAKINVFDDKIIYSESGENGKVLLWDNRLKKTLYLKGLNPDTLESTFVFYKQKELFIFSDIYRLNGYNYYRLKYRDKNLKTYLIDKTEDGFSHFVLDTAKAVLYYVAESGYAAWMRQTIKRYNFSTHQKEDVYIVPVDHVLNGLSLFKDNSLLISLTIPGKRSEVNLPLDSGNIRITLSGDNYLYKLKLNNSR